MSDYDEFGRLNVESSIVVFCDIERLDDASLTVAVNAFERAIAGGAREVLNNPSKVMRRRQLLQSFRRNGLNPFNAYDSTESPSSFEFPVFLRNEFEHDGPRTDLLQTTNEYSEALKASGEAKGLLAIEFFDCRSSKDEPFHKYGAFFVKGDVIPRHLFVSSSWIVKRPSSSSEEDIAQEAAYIRDNSFADEVAKAFRSAGIDYGRIDFVRNPAGGIATFEINTNPTVIDDGDLASTERQFVTDSFMDGMSNSLRRLLES